MSIKEDFDPGTAERLAAELERFKDDCWYDDQHKKIVYRSGQAALQAYMILQQEEMARHKWIESEKARQDLRDSSVSDWVKRYSEHFTVFWRHTHSFVPAAPAKTDPS